MDADEGLLDDVQTGMGQQRMNVGHTAIGRILDGQHRQIGTSFADRFDAILECGTGQGCVIGARLVTGLMRIGAEFALKCDCGHVICVPRNVDGAYGRRLYLLRADHETT